MCFKPPVHPWLVVSLVALAAGACTPPISEGDFDSIQPASKLYAIQKAGQARDVEAVPKLIEQLDSDDPAVRMFAIEALERITGERRGFAPYGPPHERAVAVERWVQWYRSKGSGGAGDGGASGSMLPVDRESTDAGAAMAGPVPRSNR